MCRIALLTIGVFWIQHMASCNSAMTCLLLTAVMTNCCYLYFRLNHRDLQPNIGLFWYFFTEMFEHFRPLFLFSFQMNATVLYLVPLTIKLHKQPIFLATILIALTSIFRSYPCVGDIAFYMALFPLWKHSTICKWNMQLQWKLFTYQKFIFTGYNINKFSNFIVSVMANYFVVFCFFLITSALGPTVWYLWIYCNSANANFYFGATLAFASAQVNNLNNLILKCVLLEIDITILLLCWFFFFFIDISGDRFAICVEQARLLFASWSQSIESIDFRISYHLM